MKTTLLTSFFLCLTLTTPGWAEIATVKVCLTNGLCETLTKDEFVDLSMQAFTDNRICYAKLETAMKDMDRFVQGLIISTDRARTVWQPGAQQQFNAAKEQWDAAKVCWKEKP